MELDLYILYVKGHPCISISVHHRHDGPQIVRYWCVVRKQRKVIVASMAIEGRCDGTLTLIENNSEEADNSMATRTRLPLYLQYSGMSLTTRNAPSRRSGQGWKPIAKELGQINGDKGSLRRIRSLHRAGVPKYILLSVACLLPLWNNCRHLSTEETAARDASLETLALYFMDRDLSTLHAKLACMRILLSSQLPEDMPLPESTLFASFAFLTVPYSECPLPDHILLCEIYAKCCHVTCAVSRSKSVAQGLFGTAQSIAHLLTGSVPVIGRGLDSMGEQVKKRIVPQPPMTTKAGVVTLTYTSTAKRASASMRETARMTVHGIRDVSTRCIVTAAKRFQEEQFGERLVPHKGCREIIEAAGTLGLAGLGAAAILGEAIFDTTKEVAQKAGEVTADVVGYKYGEAAGQAVQDATDTTGNLIQTCRYLVFLESRAAARGIAKNTGKLRSMDQVVDREANPHFFMDPTKSAAIKAVVKLKKADATAIRKSARGSTGSEQPHTLAVIRDIGWVEATELSFQSCIVPLICFWY